MHRPEIHVWCDEPADGPTNMAADEVLAGEALSRSVLVLRLYGWRSTTISLGAFQKHENAVTTPEIQGLPLVRRPSGGGAIVHGSDLTYAAAVPKTHPWGSTPQALYDALHESLAEVLVGRGVDAALWRPVPAAGPDAADDSFFCFDRRASGDLVVRQDVGAGPDARGCKVMGSAQRRLEAAVMQHGSLLLRANADVGGRASHRGLGELAGLAADQAAVERLVDDWLARVARRIGGDVIHEPRGFLKLRPREIESHVARFREARWTARR